VVAASPVVVRILDFFRDGQTTEELLAGWSASGRRSARLAIDRLIAASFLQRAARPPDPKESALAAWGAWNPVASLFHFSSKDVRFLRGEAAEAFEAEFARRRGRGGKRPPAPVKRNPGARRLVLPRPHATGEFKDVLLARRTWRGFGARPLSLDDLAQLLHLTWGVQFWGNTGEDDRVAFKTSPSGGARHPIEAYVMALRVAGLPRGIYHYVADTGELELVGRRATPSQLDSYLSGQWFYRPASVVVFMTAVVERELWRYRTVRSYRTVLFEAGHLCQTFCLVATWLGLAPFCTAALADSKIERAIGVDGVGEILLYAAGVGTRPADGRWVQWPEHSRGRRLAPAARGDGRRPSPRRQRRRAR
jgi:SagB-type dehydrogenase family enzyme